MDRNSCCGRLLSQRSGRCNQVRLPAIAVQKSHEQEQASFCAAEGIRMIDEEYGSGHHSPSEFAVSAVTFHCLVAAGFAGRGRGQDR